MYPDGEYIFSTGSNAIKTAKTTIGRSMFEAFLFDFELRDCINMCKRNLKLFSPCVQNYFDKEYGNDYKMNYKKAKMMKMLKMTGTYDFEIGSDLVIKKNSFLRNYEHQYQNKMSSSLFGV